MQPSKVTIFDIPIDNLTMAQALQKIQGFLGTDKTHMIFTPNAEIMMLALKQPLLHTILSSADMLVADGFGVVLGSKLLGNPLPERVAGFDLTRNIFSFASTSPISVYLLGAKPEVVSVAAKKIELEYPGVTVLGYHHGYFSQEEEISILETINRLVPDLVLVALGAPRQEQWIYQNHLNISTKICIGVGGSLDVFAGVTKRAPAFFQKNGLEWFYRLCKQPYRFIRMMALPKYVLYVLIEKWKRLKAK